MFRFINIFILDQEISGDILLELTLDSLKELQVTTFGKRFKIHSAINNLRLESKKQQQQKVNTNIGINYINILKNYNFSTPRPLNHGLMHLFKTQM